MSKQSPEEPVQKLLKLQPSDPGRLAEQVAGILAEDATEQKKVDSLLQLTVVLVKAAGAVFLKEQDGQLQVDGQLLSKQASSLSKDVLSEFTKGARLALENGNASIVSIPQESVLRIISCPVPAGKDSSGCCLSVLIPLGNSPPEPFIIILQLLTASFVQIIDDTISLRAPSKSSADLLHFISRQKEKLTLRQWTDMLREWSGCSMLAIGTGGSNSRIRLRTVSDMVKVDSRTHLSRQFTKVMQECLPHIKPIVWPGNEDDLHFEHSLLMKDLVHTTGMQQGAAVFLSGVGGGGTILVFLWSKVQEIKEKLSELEDINILLGPAFQTIFTANHREDKKQLGQISDLKKKLLAGIGVLFFLGLTFLPMDFTLYPDCRIRPVQVRYVVARFDSLLQEVLVEPGDQVEQGAALALLDGREIELELSSIEADSAKALKMRDNYLVSGAVASSQIAFFDYQRLQDRAKLLLGRQQQLRLQSPVPGIVLSGDLKRAEGGPVVKGQVLFEIAPLDTLLLELAVLDADVVYVEKKSIVHIRFDAFPNRIWQGEIERISPKSELINGQNVFIASLQLKNEDTVLQPGMQGRASIECGRRTIGWIYFHKPWYALRRLLMSLF